MTTIIVDKNTAIKAVCKYFDIELLGTEPTKFYGSLPQDILIEFDFEKDCEEDGCQK